MGDGVGQQAVVRLLRDRRPGHAGDFRGPCIGQRVTRQFDDVQLLRRWQAVQRDEVGEFLNRRRGVCRRDALMRRLEEDVQVHARFVALVFLKNSGNDGPGKARLVGDERESLGRQDAGVGFLAAARSATRALPAANHQHMRRHGDADGRREAVQAVPAHREPASGVQQIAGVIADVGELEARDRDCYRRFPVCLRTRKSGSWTRLSQARGQRHAHRRILRDALGRQRLVLFVENLRDAQVIVQFEDGDAQVLQRRELDLGAGA